MRNEVKLFDLLSNPNFMNGVYLPVCPSHPPALSIFPIFGDLFITRWETEVILNNLDKGLQDAATYRKSKTWAF